MEVKFIVKDEWLGEREIDQSSYIALIKDQHRLLCAMRDDGRVPSKLLLEDIQVYAYILEHPQAEVKATEYLELMDKQRQKHGFGVSKMKVARMLNWFQ